LPYGSFSNPTALSRHRWTGELGERPWNYGEGGEGEVSIKNQPKESKAFDPSYPRQGGAERAFIMLYDGAVRPEARTILLKVRVYGVMSGCVYRIISGSVYILFGSTYH